MNISPSILWYTIDLAANDRGIKFDDYASHGVTEYWIIDPVEETVEQYRANDGAYELVIKAQTGAIRSFVVDEFEIPVRAIFDEVENQQALSAISFPTEKKCTLNTPEHLTFLGLPAQQPTTCA